jgi:hypothetical protein
MLINNLGSRRGFASRVMNSFVSYTLGSFLIAPELINPYYNIYLMKNRNPGAFNSEQDSGQSNFGTVLRNGIWNGVFCGASLSKNALNAICEAFESSGEDQKVIVVELAEKNHNSTSVEEIKELVA